MPAPYSWTTGDQITADRLNSVATLLAPVATTGAYTDLTGKPTIPAAKPWQFLVESYGAVGDGTTDDTAAINSAVTAAVAYAQANRFYAEVIFRPVTYLLSSPTTKGPYGNAQIQLPYIAGTGQKVTLVFRGVVDATAHPHWLQTTPQRSGTVLRTVLTGQTSDATYKAPSVVGGPTTLGLDSKSFPDHSNMLFVVDGITITTPPNPTLVGFDLRQVATANINTAACLAEQSPSGAPDFSTTPSSPLGVALYMPRGGNGDNVNVGLFTAYGFAYGVGFADHFTAQRLLIVYCGTAFFVSGRGNSAGASILYTSVEATPTIIDASTMVGQDRYPLNITRLDIEGSPGVTVDVIDAGNHLTGAISWNDIFRTAPTVTGAGNLKIISQESNVGAQTAPAVPATTVALTNPFWRDCAVSVTGGTVTVIAVDGQTLGVTSGTVFVPSGKTIALTYSAAPTWKWIAF
jgi:hypothetical protein